MYLEQINLAVIIGGSELVRVQTQHSSTFCLDDYSEARLRNSHSFIEGKKGIFPLTLKQPVFQRYCFLSWVVPRLLVDKGRAVGQCPQAQCLPAKSLAISDL